MLLVITPPNRPAQWREKSSGKTREEIAENLSRSSCLAIVHATPTPDDATTCISTCLLLKVLKIRRPIFFRGNFQEIFLGNYTKEKLMQ